MSRTFSVELKCNSQNITNNTSNVTVWVYITTSGNTYMNNSHSGKVTFNGTTYNFTGNAPKNKKTTLYKKTLDIKHLSDGTKTVSASATFEWVGTTKATLKDSKSLTLPVISAAATLSSVSNATTGGNCVVKFTSQTSQNYQLKFTGGTGANAVTVIYPAASEYLAGNSATATDGVSVSMPVDTWNKIMPDSTTGQVTCELITYNAEKTKIGSSSKKTFTLTAKSTCKPTVPTAALECIDGLDATHYLKGKSKVKITPSSTMAGGEPTGGAAVSYYVIKIGDITYPNLTAGNALTSEAFQTTGQVNISITAYDTRGRSASADGFSVEIYDYVPPTVKVDDVYRCNNDGIANAKEGHWGCAKWTVTLSNINDNNFVKSTVFRYKRAPVTGLAEDTWHESDPQVDANGRYIFGSGELSPDYSYIVQVIVTDNNNIQSTPVDYYLQSGKVLIDFNKSGRAIAFGAFSSKNDEDAFECGLNTYFTSSVVRVKNKDVITEDNIGTIFNNLPTATINQIKQALGIN